MRHEFSINVVGEIDGFEMERVRQAVIDQAASQGIIACVTLNHSALDIALSGREDNVHAYEAALRCWAGLGAS